MERSRLDPIGSPRPPAATQPACAGRTEACCSGYRTTARSACRRTCTRHSLLNPSPPDSSLSGSTLATGTAWARSCPRQPPRAPCSVSPPPVCLGPNRTDPTGRTRSQTVSPSLFRSAPSAASGTRAQSAPVLGKRLPDVRTPAPARDVAVCPRAPDTQVADVVGRNRSAVCILY